MVTSRNLVVLLFSLFILLFSFSCDLFQPADPDYLKKIDEEVAWAKAAKLTVTVAFPNEWGTSVNAGTNRCYDNKRTTQNPRQGYAFTVEFNSNAVYGEAQWRAYKSGDLPPGSGWYLSDAVINEELKNLTPLTPEEIFFSDQISLFTDVVINITDPVTIIPYCEKQPRIVRSDPPLGTSIENSSFLPNRSISVTFASPVDTDSLKFEPGYIEITGHDGKDMTDYYIFPIQYNEATYTMTIESKGEITTEITNAIFVKLGTGIKSPDGKGMARTIEISYVTAGMIQISEWNWECKDGKITFNWTMPSGMEGLVAHASYRYNYGSVRDITVVSNSVTIPDVRIYDGAGTRDGVMYIPSYAITITYGNNETTFKTYAIPDLFLSNKNEGYILIDEDNKTALYDSENLNKIFVLAEDIVLDNHTPIGDKTAPFTGTVYGMGNTITVNSFADSDNLADENIGLFGFLTGDAIIRDVIVRYNNIKITGTFNGNTHIGCIAGCMEGNARIENVIITGDTEFNRKDQALAAGGVVGYFDSSNIIIRNVYSSLNLTVKKTGSNNSEVGGIFGSNGNTTSPTVRLTPVSQVTVAGNILHEQEIGLMYTGGVAGNVQMYFASYEDMEFKGTLTATKTDTDVAYIGGIVGNSNGDVNKFIFYSELNSSGSINIPENFTSNRDVYVGGIIGHSVYSNIYDAITSGNIVVNKSGTGILYCGGVCGWSRYFSNYEKCQYEQGNISVYCNGTIYLGGVFGRITTGSNIKECHSMANLLSVDSNIDDPAYIGGFAGNIGSINLTGFYSKTDIIANGKNIHAGGLIGQIAISNDNDYTFTITECYNLGNVTLTGTDFLSAGGIIGSSENINSNITYINNSYSRGNISVTCTDGGSPVFAGGVAGYLYNNNNQNIRFQLEKCFSTGNVSASSASNYPVHAGGIVGRLYATGTATTNSFIRNNVFIGESVTAAGGSSRNAGRIYGASDATNSNNHALDTITVTGSALSKGAANKDGADISAATRYTESFWHDTLQFDDSYNSGKWVTTNVRFNGYPLLRAPLVALPMEGQ